MLLVNGFIVSLPSLSGRKSRAKGERLHVRIEQLNDSGAPYSGVHAEPVNNSLIHVITHR